MKTPIRLEALRFLISGAVNTVATYAIYLALLHLLGYVVAYTITYLCGILLAYVLNTRYVFRVRRSGRGIALFSLVYIFQYLVGLAVLRLAVSLLGIPETLALLASMAVTLPMTFLLSRYVLKPRTPPTLPYADNARTP
jgi:putative flippase GtrA